MRDVYVISVAKNLTGDRLAKGLLAGSVFRLRSDVAGPKAVRFRA